MDNEKKIALVTGASRGIGRACAIALGKKGYTVIINYNSNEDAANEVKGIIEAAGSEADIYKANVANPDEVKQMFREITKKFGKIDVLVNNAGIVKDEYVLMMTPDTIDKCLDLLGKRLEALKRRRKVWNGPSITRLPPCRQDVVVVVDEVVSV